MSGGHNLLMMCPPETNPLEPANRALVELKGHHILGPTLLMMDQG